jgi:hypothetical protein
MPFARNESATEAIQMSRWRTPAPAAIAAVLATTPTPVAQAKPRATGPVDPGFETGDLTGWTVVSGDGETLTARVHPRYAESDVLLRSAAHAAGLRLVVARTPSSEGKHR